MGIAELSGSNSVVRGIKGNSETNYRTGLVNLTPADIGAVSGVKGNSETDYRTGDVNITPANIGAVDKSGDTMTGALNFTNNTWNKIGDDCQLGGCNQAGKVGLKGINGATGLYFSPYSGSTAQSLSVDGSGNMTATGNLGTSSGYLKATANSNTVTIGSQNTSWCHFSNSADRPFYFNKAVHVDGYLYKYNGARVQYVPTVLYNNTSGANGAITLSASAANYNHMRIHYRNASGTTGHVNQYNTTEVFTPNGKYVNLAVVGPDTTSATNISLNTRLAYISGTGISNARSLSGGVSSSPTAGVYNEIYIVRVEGWND